MMNLERAQELKGSLIWANACEELDIKIHHLTQKLKTCKPEELEKIQIEISVFEAVKRLPDDIVSREESPQ